MLFQLFAPTVKHMSKHEPKLQNFKRIESSAGQYISYARYSSYSTLSTKLLIWCTSVGNERNNLTRRQTGH